jgi:heme A synthase
MQTAVRVLALRRLGVTVVAMTVALMVLGSWVKATGSGLACPDWPQCYGEWLPPFPSSENGGTWQGEPVHFGQAQILYEWGHRLLASLLGIPLFAFAALAVTGTELSRGARWLPPAAFAVLGVQVALGGVTVVGQNAAPLTTAHLATATVFLVLVTLAASFASLHPTPEGRVLSRRHGGRAHAVFPGERPDGGPSDGAVAVALSVVGLARSLRRRLRGAADGAATRAARFPGEPRRARRAGRWGRR